MRLKLWFGLAALVFQGPLSAQSLNHEGEQQNSLSRLLIVRSSEPVMGKCNPGWKDRCFRIFLQFTPREDQEIGVGLDSRSMPTAYSASGAQCEGYSIGGIDNSAFDSYRNSWRTDRLRFADKNKPVVATFEFKCDNNITINEEVTIQTSFDLYIDGRQNGRGRYVFSRVRLTGR